jgi:hypothetical protein
MSVFSCIFYILTGIITGISNFVGSLAHSDKATGPKQSTIKVKARVGPDSPHVMKARQEGTDNPTFNLASDGRCLW